MKQRGIKFRPVEQKLYIMQDRLRGEPCMSHKFMVRGPKYKFKDANGGKQFLIDAHSRLHYLACHAPAAVKKQYQAKYEAFRKKYFGATHLQSMRFANKHTAHSFL